MKSNHPIRRDNDRGFALVVTLSMMILLTVIAVGLLSLSSISLRKSTAESAGNIARANARLALMLAIGELQKTAGPDQRITADRSIYLSPPTNTNDPDDTPDTNVVGVWESWSPRLATDSTTGVLNTANGTYASKKTSNFKGWLTSTNNPDDLTSTTWSPSYTDNDVELFTMKTDGYSQYGSKINVNLVQPGTRSTAGKESSGSFAWTIAQEGTKAKINIGGPERNQIQDPNDQLQAQSRPVIVGSANLKQPNSEWDKRASKIISPSQLKLDTTLWQGNLDDPLESADYTVSSMGLLTDTVYGGLKTDINLGFDMPNSSFIQPRWGEYNNPFMASGLRGPAPSTSMFKNNQRPLFRNAPSMNTGTTKVTLNFSNANPGNAPTIYDLPGSAVPTFTTLRSYYRTPNFLYSTGDGATVFERPMDSVTLVAGSPTITGGAPYPGGAPLGRYSQTSYRPVLDRVMFVMSILIGSDSEVRLVFTPVITLWNPYNVALEIEAAVACPWLDMPYNINWTISPRKGDDPATSAAMSRIMANSDNAKAEGRQTKPYFYAVMTNTGSATGAPNAGGNIRFKPGEVRVFAPATANDTEYLTTSSATQALPPGQTIYMKPVSSVSDMKNLKGGLLVPMKNKRTGDGFNRPVLGTDTVSVVLESNRGKDYPFGVTLEDSYRAKFPTSTNVRGQAVGDVQMVQFAQSGSIASLITPAYPAAQLRTTRTPIGVIETYHRVAKESRTARRSDIVYTVNPRQPYINQGLTDATFATAPHYETIVRAISTTDQILETDETGRSAFYGRSNSRSGGGYSQLAFFEAPQQPLISIAGFQHADLAGTPYSTGYQVGNSWANPYLANSRAWTFTNTGKSADPNKEASFTRGAMAVYDYSYLANEALWDSFFCSSITDSFELGSTTVTESIWQGNGIAPKKKEAKNVLSNFLDDPQANPLRNSRMRFYAGKESPQALESLKNELMQPEGCLKIAAHLQVDGAFNINSTSRKAWIAVLSGMRDAEFKVKGDSGTNTNGSSSNKSPFPRMRYPMGTDTNMWQGYRTLSDADLANLADKIIAQVRLRGPFLSLGEFVNRRVDSSNLSFKGALQAAIDNTTINKTVTDACDPFDTDKYTFPVNVRSPNNVSNIGVGIPGYLTQADLLQPLAPIITPRSDTFTIRAYGEAKDGSGKVVAVARCEAVVQRVAEYVDEANTPETLITGLNTTNATFGRKFKIVSFRYLSDKEAVPTT